MADFVEKEILRKQRDPHFHSPGLGKPEQLLEKKRQKDAELETERYDHPPRPGRFTR